LFYIGSVAYGGSGAVTFDDYGYLGGAPIPTTNTAVARMQKVHVTTTASPDPAITGVRIYRTKVSGSGWWLVAQVTGPQGAVAYDDVIADANLGAAASFIDTSAAGYLAVAMSNIAPGPSPTTARRVYRTKVNATQLYLWGTVADNVTTAYTDVLADSNLSIVAPTSDTSGLQQVAGQVTTGATTMVVANVGPFEPTGGWAVIGNGEQVIRYTGKTGNTLVGIPPTGIGAIVAGVAYNSTVTAAPMIVGLPTSGRRALNQALAAGDTINFMVFRDNAARMTDLGTMVKGGPGIREEYIQDRRLAIPEARARGDATLAQRPLEDVTLTYTCRDLRTASGKTITVNLPAPWNIAGTFKIQRVTIAQFRASATQYPTFTVTASTDLFSFDDWLRQIEAKA
jgi:hypothetical protein